VVVLIATVAGPLDEFRSIVDPPMEVLFACDAMVLLCGELDSGPGVYSIAIQTQWDSVHTGPGE
jgi:hypothetical protein